MKKFLVFAAAFMIATVAVASNDPVHIGEVSTTFRMVGANDKIVVKRFNDPKVKNVACFLSNAETGGISGSLGFAEDPARMSIACRATGKIEIVDKIDRGKSGEIVFDAKASPFFKVINVTRFYDEGSNALVYLAWSTKLINGSPYNAITAIALNGGQ